jgi:RNA polymerase sigma factor (sigma-70 family)
LLDNNAIVSTDRLFSVQVASKFIPQILASLFKLSFLCLNKHTKLMTAIEFNYSVSRSSKALRPFALRLTKDVDEANDLLQDTMLKALTHRDKFTDGTNLKAWLYTIMKNTFITNYQRMVRKKTFIDTTENLHYLNSAQHVTSNGAESTFALADINTAMDNLEESHRVPFMMHFRGFKYHEIAEKLRIPIGTVKNRIHLARKQLKVQLYMYAD